MNKQETSKIPFKTKRLARLETKEIGTTPGWIQYKTFRANTMNS